jgi:hypothetical protein
VRVTVSRSRLASSTAALTVAVATLVAPPTQASGAAAGNAAPLSCVAGSTCSGPVAAIDPQGAFIAGAIRDILGRAEAPGDDPFWRAQLELGQTREQMAQALAGSDEYRHALIASFYERFLHRAPDTSTYSFWLGQMSAGATDEEVISSIVGSPEYNTLAGGTNAAFISRAYSDLLGRAPSASEVASWESFLAAGTTHQQMAQSIATSAEYRHALITTLYARFLHRAPDSAAYSFWLGQMGAGAGDEQVIASLVGSLEYFSRDPGWQATIDWGDGSASKGTVVGGTVSASHTYATTGSFPLLVTLVDDRGVVATVGANANVVAGSNRFDHGKPLVNRRQGTAIVPVTLPGPGALRFGGAGVAVRPLADARASGVTTVDSAHTIRLLVRARGKARRRLEHSGVVTVTVALAFTPVAGTPRRESTRITLRKAR